MSSQNLTPPPAGFKKLDLHIHTPFSLCYIDHMKPEARRVTRLEEIVAAALRAGLDGIAVTDHNGVERVDEMTRLADGTGLTVLPGTEITTRGGHCLAIFEPATPLDAIRELVLEAGFGPEHWGDGFKRSDVWMDQVFEGITRRGGLAIAAHVDREPRGFIASDELPSDKLRIYNHAGLSALEITDLRRKARWNTGSDPRYRQPRACVQGSDAHAPEEVGRRPVFLRMDEVSLAGIRAALASYESDVLFPESAVAG
jgi:hypothetical protein